MQKLSIGDADHYTSGVTVRLNEIAERTGVSMSTVSRVLNERPGVNEHTRRKVLIAVDVMGYDRPVRLRGRSAGLVGLVIPELDNPFFPRLAHQIELSLARRGFAAVLCSQTLEGVHEDDYVRMLLEHAVSGIVFVSGLHAVADLDPLRYQRLVQLGLPIVLVNGAQPDVAAHFVSTDDTISIELGLAHLQHMGHRRIGLAMGEARYVPVRRRVAAFCAGLVERGLMPDEATARGLVQTTTYTIEGGELAAERLLDSGVTGVLCGSDVIALGVIRAATQRGLKVPVDLSVVGSDDSAFVEFTNPPLTTVRQPVAGLAEAVCRELVDQIAGASAHHGEVLLPPELVVRGSTARVRELPQ